MLKRLSHAGQAWKSRNCKTLCNDSCSECDKRSSVYRGMIEIVTGHKASHWSITFLFNPAGRWAGLIWKRKKAKLFWIAEQRRLPGSIRWANEREVMVWKLSHGGRPSFLAPAEQSTTGTFVLLQLIKEKVKTPIVAAGGIANGRGIAAAFTQGTDAA